MYYKFRSNTISDRGHGRKVPGTDIFVEWVEIPSLDTLNAHEYVRLYCIEDILESDEQIEELCVFMCKRLKLSAQQQEMIKNPPKGSDPFAPLQGADMALAFLFSDYPEKAFEIYRILCAMSIDLEPVANYIKSKWPPKVVLTENVHRIRRSDLDAIIAIGPSGTRTRREAIQKSFAKRGYYSGRMDILLGRDANDKSYLVFPGPNGTLVGDVEFFAPDDIAWAVEESKRCWEAAQTEPGLLEGIMRYA